MHLLFSAKLCRFSSLNLDFSTNPSILYFLTVKYTCSLFFGTLHSSNRNFIVHSQVTAMQEHTHDEKSNEDLWGKRWPNFATLAIHAGQDPEKWNSRDLVPPITLATTFKQTKPGIQHPFYGRCGNPTRSCLEECVAAIEDGKYGHCFSSGMAAIHAIINCFLQSGDHIITSDDVYGGTNKLFKEYST